MNINQELTLNLSADGIPPRLHMVQGDANTRTVVATLWDGAQPYTVPAASAVTVSGNTVTAPVATQMLAVAGVVQAQVDIYGTATGKAAEKLATFRFAVEVAPSVYPDAEIISSDYFNIIAADISKAVEAAARAEAAQAAASAAQQGAETARDDAVNAKTSAESAKTAAVAAQNKSEQAQTNAEAAQTAAGQSAAAAQTAREGAETAQSGAQASQSAAESAKAAAQAAQSGAETARAGAETAKGAAEDSAEDAEAWAVGQRNGADVPSTDPAYHNNAKYYKDQAQAIAGGEFVSYGAPQTLTNEQKQQARDNINAPAPYTAGENISISGSVIATKVFPCNPNLLDNWYFGNPVNQRGQTSYAGAGYGIDRFLSGGGELKIVPSGTVYTCNAPGQVYRQRISPELRRALAGKKVTFSLLCSGISGNWMLTDVNGFSAAHSDVPIDSELKSWTFTVADGENVGEVGWWAGDAGAEITTLAAKLELGTQQTLAHKEYGDWVLNEIPDFGTELLKCQRYYYRVHYVQYQTINMSYEDVAYAFIMLPLPVAMRIDNPVLTQSKPIALGTGEKILAAAEAKGCMARLAVNYTAISNAQRGVYSYCADPEGVTFELSADL